MLMSSIIYYITLKKLYQQNIGNSFFVNKKSNLSCFYGGEYRNRTDDLLLARQAL